MYPRVNKKFSPKGVLPQHPMTLPTPPLPSHFLDPTFRYIRKKHNMGKNCARTIAFVRFGIGVDRDNTFEEVGRHLSITRERVRQIEVKALRKLKHPNRLRVLEILNTA